MAAANDLDTLRLDPARTLPPSTSPPGLSDLEAKAMLTVERGVAQGVAQGIAAVGGMLAKPPEPASAGTPPRPDNRALIISTAALFLVGGQWLWSGRAHTDRMDRIEDRVDSIEAGLVALDKRISDMEKVQLKQTYATLAIAQKVGAPIQLESD